MSESGPFKKSMQPTKRSKKKKCAQAALHTSHLSQTHTPLIVPSDSFQANTNQSHTIRPGPIQFQTLGPRTQIQPAQPQPQPTHTQSQSQPQPILTQIPSVQELTMIISEVLQAYTNKSQTIQPEPIQSRSLRTRTKRSRPQAQPPQPQHQIQSTQPQPQPTQPQSTQPEHTQPQPIPTQIPSVQDTMVNQIISDVLQAYTNKSQSIQLEPIQSQSLRRRTAQSRLQVQPTQPKPQPQPQIQPTQPQPQPSQPQPQHTELQPILTQIPRVQEFTVVNQMASSTSLDSGGNNGNKIMILPEADGFDKHKLVIGTIASIIRTNFWEAQPSWKKFSKDQRDMWFDIFKSKFTWPSEHDDIVRRNFEKRGVAKMSELMQEVRKNLEKKPSWIKEHLWTQLKAYWESSSFKEKSEINKRNREAMPGASLHTGGSVSHRLHWKRMKAENGTDPSFADFYFRTHQKKDHSWVGLHAKSTYEKFEQRKSELSLQSSTSVLEENDGGSHQSIGTPSDLDLWVNTVGGKKKGRIFGLGSVGKMLVTSPSPSINVFSDPNELDAMNSEVQALNDSLQRQERENIEIRKELSETKTQLAALMQQLGFVGSSAVPLSSSQHSNGDEDSEDEDYDSGHIN